MAQTLAAKGKKHIVSTVIEHHAILHTLDALKKQGFEYTLVPVDSEGYVSPDDIAAAIRPDTALVSVMIDVLTPILPAYRNYSTDT